MLSDKCLKKNKIYCLIKNKEFMDFIIWLLCGFVCYMIAQKNGRNEWLGALLGCLFGIFAIIGYLIAGKKNGGTTTPPTATA